MKSQALILNRHYRGGDTRNIVCATCTHSLVKAVQDTTDQPVTSRRTHLVAPVMVILK